MGEILPDGSIQSGYGAYCQKCGKQIITNSQGNEIGDHKCILTVLVSCEYSGTVRDAFLSEGHDAWSNDLLDTESKPERHLKMDCIEAIKSRRWDRIIIHIPCTAMGVCGNSTYGTGKAKNNERIAALEWSLKVWDVACEQSDHVAMENPASVLFPMLRDKRGATVQYVQPWQFGHMEQKKTGFALKGLPMLTETNNVYDEMMKLPKKVRERIHYMSPSKDRGKERARFFLGISTAIAQQWGKFL